MHKSIAAATTAFSLAFASAAGAQPVGLGTSPQGTLTYAVGAAVAKTLTEVGHIQARVQPSSGTGAMIPLVNSGEIDLGFCNTLELYDAFHGVGTFDKRPIRSCEHLPLSSQSRSVCSCAPTPRSRRLRT